MEEFMTTKDDYIKKLKDQLERWNADISKLEAKTKGSVAEMKGVYEKQLKELHYRRNAMQKTVAEIQKASDQAWDHLRKGADTAWKTMAESIKKARSGFK
jgi:frataxin-like iron-binding protein CyaY